MLDINMKEMLQGFTNEEIAKLIDYAYKEKQSRDEAKELKYMGAIKKAIEDYLENVGKLTFYFECETDDYEPEVNTSIKIDKANPPAYEQGCIYI